jgi:hypothetical protein
MLVAWPQAPQFLFPAGHGAQDLARTFFCRNTAGDFRILLEVLAPSPRGQKG